jgi:hypothetical protein
MPNQAADGSNPNQPSDDLTSKYHSIGQFYDEVENGGFLLTLAVTILTLPPGIKDLIKKDPDLFKKKMGTQFSSAEFFQSCIVVEDGDSAIKALTLIVDEGEGGVGVEDSHYGVFVNLHEQRKDWENYDLVVNPTTSDYQDPVLRQVSLTISSPIS